MVGVDDANLHAGERLSATTPRCRRHVGVGGIAAVRSERFGHAEQGGPCPGLSALLGREQPFQTARPQGGEINTDRARVPCQRFRLIGPAPKQVDSLAFQQTQSGFGLWRLLGHQGGTGQQNGQNSTTEAAHPEERHWQIQPGVRGDTARRQPRSHGAQCAAVRVHHSLGGSAAPRGEDDDQRVSGGYRLGHGVDDPAGPLARGGSGEPVDRPDLTQGRKFRLAPRLEVVQVAVPTEFLDAQKELH